MGRSYREGLPSRKRFPVRCGGPGGNQGDVQAAHSLHASPPRCGSQSSGTGWIAYNAGMPGATSLGELAAEAAGETRNRGLYDRDFLAWTQEQAEALRRRDVDGIDWDNVIEEVETLGRSEKHAWTSYCRNVVSHLLKIEHSGSDRHLSHWRKEVEGWRVEMCDRLEDNPSMNGELAALLARAWSRGRRDAVADLVELGNPGDWATEKSLRRGWQRRLPEELPYALEDIAGYDPYVKNSRPRLDVWPAPVAKALNAALETDYPVRYRAPERGHGRSR